MNEISLVFYGETSKVQNHLLFHLKLLKLLPATETQNGFYAVESRFGREIPKKLSLGPECNGADAVLLYRYLSDDELKSLESSAEKPVVFYILPHKLFDRDYIKAKLQTRVPQAGFISDFSGNSLLQSYNLVRKEFKATNILRFNATGKQAGEKESFESIIHLPVIILFLLKLFINPMHEIRRYSVLVKYSNQRILSRLLELFLAIDFVINAVFFNLVRLVALRIWYSSKYFVGLIRVGLIKFGFAIRHVFLMSGFKSYGSLVDLYYSIRWFFNFLYYRGFAALRHALLISAFRFYGLLVDSYYSLRWFFNFFYYRGFAALRHALLISAFRFYGLLVDSYYSIRWFFIFFYYRGFAALRHALLISAFRFYGLVFDVCTFSYRFAKLILLYPIFKIYWFLAFQYKKRFKKLLP